MKRERGHTHFDRISANVATGALGQLTSVFGNTWYVDSVNGSDSYSGKSPGQAVATLAQAESLASAGDTILIAPGHSETLAVEVTVNLAGLRIIGLGQGQRRPQFTVGANIDGIALDAANILLYGLYFNEGTAAHTASIDVAATKCKIQNCHFDCGVNDLESITIAAAGTDLEVEDCTWKVTANGPDAAIEVESASADGLVVKNCWFDGGSDVNAWDAGAINSGLAHTKCLIKDNSFLFGPAIIFSAAATGLVVGNRMGEGTLGSMLDPGSCMCVENYEQDAIDESGRLFPSLNPDETGVAEILDQLSGANGVVTFPAAAAPANAVSLAEVLRSIYDRLVGDGTDAAVNVRLGKRVDRATAVLPQTTAAAIFTVAGGRVLITNIVGEVTTIIQTQINNTKLTANPTTGTSVDMCSVLDISADEAGCLYGIDGTPANALIGANAGNVPEMDKGIVVNVGTIDLDCAASNTGSVKWQIWYIPLDDGATVVAA